MMGAKKPLFTPEELAEMAEADKQIDSADRLSYQEYCESDKRDRDAGSSQHVAQCIEMPKYERGNKELMRAYRHASYIRNREKAKAYQREYYRRNREKVLEYEKEYRLKHKEERDALRRAYYWKNRDRILAQARDYKARRRAMLLQARREQKPGGEKT